MNTIPEKIEFYTEIKLAPSAENPRSVIFVSSPNSPELPEEMAALRREYEDIARIITILFDGDVNTRKSLFLLIHQAADVGFRGVNFKLSAGRENLVVLRNAVVDLAHGYRDAIFSEYTKLLILFGALPFVIGIILYLTNSIYYSIIQSKIFPLQSILSWVVIVCWIIAGSTIAVWAEFAIRMQSGISYSQLLNFDPSRWRPRQRVTITIVVSFVFAYVLSINAIQIGMGGVLLNEFAADKPFLSLGVGGVTGLAFTAVQELIMKVRPVSK